MPDQHRVRSRVVQLLCALLATVVLAGHGIGLAGNTVSGSHGHRVTHVMLADQLDALEDTAADADLRKDAAVSSSSGVDLATTRVLATLCDSDGIADSGTAFRAPRWCEWASRCTPVRAPDAMTRI